MADFHAITRFHEGASVEERTAFGRELLHILDLCGVRGGEFFVVAHPRALFPHEACEGLPDEVRGRRTPPAIHRSEAERERAARADGPPPD